MYIYIHILTMKQRGFPSILRGHIRPALHRMVVHCRPPGAGLNLFATKATEWIDHNDNFHHWV